MTTEKDRFIQVYNRFPHVTDPYERAKLYDTIKNLSQVQYVSFDTAAKQVEMITQPASRAKKQAPDFNPGFEILPLTKKKRAPSRRLKHRRKRR